MAPCVVLIDAFGQIFRSYFAFSSRPLMNSDGKNVNALFGFFKSLFQIIREYQPTHLAVAYDSRTPTFRHEMYHEYKAHRDEAPEDLLAQLPFIEEILSVLDICLLQFDGYEADDLLATAAVFCRNRQIPCLIVSNDKDLLQLVGGSVKVLRSDYKGAMRIMDAQAVFDDRGVKPEQIPDWLALVGDTSDNIPGVKGIGEKTCCKLLAEFGTLDKLYSSLEQIPQEALRKKLQEGRQAAYLSRSLVLLRDDVPCHFNLERSVLTFHSTARAADLFLKHQAKSLATEVRKLGVSQEEEEQITLSQSISSQKLEGQYETVTSYSRLQYWAACLKKAQCVAIDLETDSLDTLTARIAGFSLSCCPGEACYIPLIAPDCSCLTLEVVLSELRPILLQKNFRIIGQNLKFDWKILRRHGLTLPQLYFDTMIAAWMLEADARSYNLEVLGLKFLGLKGVAYDDIVEKGKNFSQVPIDKAARYGAEDADLTFRLYQYLEKQLQETGLEEPFFTLEMPLVTLLARMEDAGILLRSKELIAYGYELEQRLELIQEEIYALCQGKRFNLNSPKQLQETLFQDRALVPPERAKLKTGWSTNSDVLQGLVDQDPIVSKILIYRALAKLKSTYVDTLPNLIHPLTGRLHTQFLQNGTATGRVASKDPNLQNIPVRDEDGLRIRRAFVPQPGYLFLSADYSQIELVVLAHLSCDHHLAKAFLEKKDIHKRTAALMFGTTEELVNTEMRQAAKAINFGIMYGMSAFRLSHELKISRKEAQSFLDSYHREFSGVRAFFTYQIAEAEKNGFVQTILGHRRYIGNILGKNRVEKQAAERMAMNTPIQGSAADIVKMAMIAIDQELISQGLQSRLLLQVHDELLLEVPLEEKEVVAALLKKIMENIISLKVPLNVGLKTGLTWGDLHEIS